MTDRRLWPCNGRVAPVSLQGQAEAERFVEPMPMRVTVPVADLLVSPGGRRDRQVIMGERVDELESRDGWSFVTAAKDGFVGYLPTEVLGPDMTPTHRVAATATHVYPAPDIKTRERMTLSLGALLKVTEQEGRFAETPLGFVPAIHLSPVDRLERDPVAVAERLIGTPYLWGGNSRLGLDCSGLVQAACVACGIPCPGDSDQQEKALGAPLPEGAAPRRGDLVFWKGHVAWVADETRILHANAWHMAVSYEDREAAIARIEAAGDGSVTSVRRL